MSMTVRQSLRKINSDRVRESVMYIVEYCIVCRSRFVENLLEFAGKCIYRNDACMS